MRTVGLITEYNPFHNGHAYHLKESLRVSGSDASVAVMSGHFLQRGEPALVNKWLRNEMALAAGVDLVFELPVVFACASAPHFAFGATASLAASGLVDAVCFGSESEDLKRLQDVADLLVRHEDEIEGATVKQMADGCSYPQARSRVLSQWRPDIPSDVICSPNNILGIEYLRAIGKAKQPWDVYSIQRTGPGYHDPLSQGRYASATGIRQKISRGDDVSGLMPSGCYKVLFQALQQGRTIDMDKLFVALQALLLQDPEMLTGIFQVERDLVRRIMIAALQASDYTALKDEIKTKHLTMTRIQRILMYILLQIKACDMALFLQTGPLYLRLLGHSSKGQALLAKARRRKSLPMIADPARANQAFNKFYRQQKQKQALAHAMLRYDLRATALINLHQKMRTTKYLNEDYYQPVRQTG
jgi:predicted nucleotidyltransferase